MAEALGLSDRRWRELALIFNTQPAVWLHDSWFDVVPHGAVARCLRTVPAAAPQISGYLLRAFGLERNYCEDFSSPWARLALLDGPALEQLFQYLGLALRHDELQHEVRGERLRPVKEAVGIKALTFAIKRAPLLGAIPRFAFEPDRGDPQARFALIGARFCALPLAALGQPFLRRMTLKLPATWAALLNAPALDSPPPVTSVDLPPWFRKLLKELLPAWNPLFA